MSKTAEKTDPKLWEKVKTKVTKGDHGGKPGQWSARKAQMASSEYKKEGGGYKGAKSDDNHLQQWTDEDWGTKSGKESEETGERYLPKAARESLSDKEYARTSDAKRRDSKAGKQYSAQPKDVARKTKAHRSTGSGTPAEHASGKSASTKPGGSASPERGSRGGTTRAELYKQAKQKNIPGRSKMTREQLEKAVA